MTPERETVRQLQYLVPAGREVVVMSLTCAEHELPARAGVLKCIAESLQIAG